MKIKVENYGSADKIDAEDKNNGFVTYKVTELDSDSLKFLKNNLEGKIKVKDGALFITIFYDEEFFPFHTDEYKVKIGDFIAKEEIEMSMFLSSFLEGRFD